MTHSKDSLSEPADKSGRPADWPGDERSFENFILARNKAMREMDLEYARLMLRKPQASDDLCKTLMHKARYECTGIEAEYRHASRAWLDERGFGRMTGTPLLPQGELPE